MFRLGDDEDAFWFDRLFENVGGGRGQLFLSRRTAGQRFYNASQMRKAGDFFVGRNVGDMSFAKKGQEVMFADGIERNITNDDKLVPIIGGIQRDFLTRINRQTGECLFIEIGNPLGGSDQPFPIRIFADPFQDQPYPLLYFISINPFVVFFPGLISIGRWSG